MTLAQLQVTDLRNIREARIALHPRWNFFWGANGSGKTSVLEALYLLGTGHSFRTRETASLVRAEQSQFTVFARTFDEQTVSIQKHRTQPTQVRINQTPCTSASSLAHFLPSHVFYQDIFTIIDAGPAARRSLLDWGMFHVKPEYHALWKSYRHVLRQRNCLLRSQASPAEFVPWDAELVAIAHALDALREAWCREWADAFVGMLETLTPLRCRLRYYRGWDRKNQGLSLDTVLKQHFEADRARQYTHYGSHHADLVLQSDDINPRQGFSRGQQKTVLYALKLSMAAILQKENGIFLLDDFASELDFAHQDRLLKQLDALAGQFFVTSTQPEILAPAALSLDACQFVLNNGVITAA